MELTIVEVVSLLASVVSVVLACIAIWLSIVFYRMSSSLSESTREAAKDIGASVEKLEKLFDRLYADTFSMMRDTVTDMRKHAWGEAASETPNILEEAEKKAEEKTEALRKTFENRVAQILEGQKMTEGRIGKIRSELKQLVDRAIDDSRNVVHEAQEETIRRYISEYIRKRNGMVMGEKIVFGIKEFSPKQIADELRRMHKENLVEFDEENLGPRTMITMR